jgi:quercetin dioxygenase-like cupin family protein
MVSDMKAKIRLPQIEQQIAQIKRKLTVLGPLHPGSLSKQYNVCGKPGCRCKARSHPQPHGPYFKVSYVFQGRFNSRFVPRKDVKAVRSELANYKQLKKLTQDWVGLSLRLAKQKRKMSA